MLIMADDFGYELVGANGGESYRTPNLDRLATAGMRFDECHVQPNCTATRVQLMTGVYNIRNYIDFGVLDPKATTFAHLLKKAGYATGMVGKWQLGKESGAPQHFGFDESYLWQHTRQGTPRYANPGLEHNGRELSFSGGQYGPTLINDFALDFIARHRERPFFLYYSMILIHSPYQATPDSPDWDPKMIGDDEHGSDKKYVAAMVAYADKMVGRLVARLEQLGLRENTLILFLGDNGTGRGITSRLAGRAYPGGKNTSTAGGTHVPLIASWPARIPAGRVNRDLIGSVDFLTTLCEAAGAAVPGAREIDGRSFLPQLLGRTGQPREWLHAWWARDGGTPKFEFVMSTRHKLYRDGRFYDLTADPLEENPPLSVDSLTGERAVAARQLQAALDQFTHARPPHLRRSSPVTAK